MVMVVVMVVVMVMVFVDRPVNPVQQHPFSSLLAVDLTHNLPPPHPPTPHPRNLKRPDHRPQPIQYNRNFRVHIVHASSAASVDLINRHRDLPITVETCPHYLMFASEYIVDGATEYKCAPAIQNRRNNDALVTAVREGRLDGIASDHSPSPPSMKTGDFLKSWGGISGIQYTLPAVWESLVASRDREGEAGADEGRLEREDRDMVAMHRALSAFPARLLGINHLKGRISDGYHADFVVWDPKAAYDAPCAQTQTHTPYSSATMRGRVLATVVRGKFVYDVAHDSHDGTDVRNGRDAGEVFSCGNMAVSATWLRPHPRPT
jgi:dihydroorotase-like cyclic amidohydrolase